MTDTGGTTDDTRMRAQRRTMALAVSGAGTLFWLYTFYAIAQVPHGDGTGFQWLAVMPLGVIYLALTLPSLILALKDHALKTALVLGLAGLVAFALLWWQLLDEFHMR